MLVSLANLSSYASNLYATVRLSFPCSLITISFEISSVSSGVIGKCSASILPASLPLFDHVYLGRAALDSAMIIYCRLSEGHGVTEHMVIGNAEPPRQVWQ
jgi:hypothetical protein